ncbi:MAG: hypothetical protein IPK80_20360 [Nannocystis sp.]|nr:hypothetical protein [Nannocystis sp.]
MENRVRRLIEAIHQKGSCPRLQVDLTREGIVCPDFVCEKWGERLIIDLDPSYPLDLRFTATGLDVDLSFGGYVTRCTFPYAAIYMIVDRGAGQQVFFEENAPASVRREMGLTLAPQRDPATSSRERAAGESRRRRRGAKADDDGAAAPAAREPALSPLAAVPAPAEPAEPAEPADAEAPADKDMSVETGPSVAERRRAIFRVIDGGK